MATSSVPAAPSPTDFEQTQSFIAWTLRRFSHQRMVLTSGFGLEGCALIDMYAAQGQPLEVVYLDTGFFFPETYQLIDRLRARYPHLDFVNRGTSLSPQAQAAQYGDRLWQRDPDLCCRLRKVDPLVRALQEVDVWVTALRRDQSASRAHLKLVEWNWKYQVLKICPLADWSRSRVWEYVQSREVPCNPLHQQGYPSIGCTHCTRPVPGSSPDSYSRAGRWAGHQKTECGLHT